MSRVARRILILVTVLAWSACDRLPTPTEPAPPGPAALAVPATVISGESTDPIGGLLFACDGQMIQTEGTVTNRWQTTIGPTGNWITNQHVRFDLTGESLSTGARYRGVGGGSATQVFAMPSGGAFTYSQVFRLIDIVQGSADDGYFTVRAHWTIDANGRVSVESFDVEWECRG